MGVTPVQPTPGRGLGTTCWGEGYQNFWTFVKNSRVINKYFGGEVGGCTDTPLVCEAVPAGFSPERWLLSVAVTLCCTRGDFLSHSFHLRTFIGILL